MLKNNKNNQVNQNLKSKALSLLSKAIAKILLNFRMPRHEFINLLDEKLVLEAKKQDPDASNVAIAIRTGIDRRYISNHLKGKLPTLKPEKLTVILEDIRWTAEKFYKSNKIPKNGPFKTFQSICEERASGSLTYKAILGELVKNKNILDLGDKIELISLKHDTKKSNSKYSQITAIQINRLIETIFFNLTKNNKKDRLIQRTVYSTQINPKNHKKLHTEIESLIDGYYKEITELIIEFEDDVEIDKYPQYGISFLEYKLEE